MADEKPAEKPAASKDDAKPADAEDAKAAEKPAAKKAEAAKADDAKAKAEKPAAPAQPAKAPAAKKPAAKKAPAKKKAKEVLPPAIVPVSRRGFISWVGAGWGAFAASALVSGGVLQRFLFPNVLFEPPTQFTLGFPDEYSDGVHVKWKAAYGVWLVRTPADVVHEKPGFYALSTICTHLGCPPNWLEADLKFKCPCHGSGFRATGINFEGPAPRPLERHRILFAPDGQIMVDKGKKYQHELGQWADPEAFLAYG